MNPIDSKSVRPNWNRSSKILIALSYGDMRLRKPSWEAMIWRISSGTTLSDLVLSFLTKGRTGGCETLDVSDLTAAAAAAAAGG